MSIPAQTCFGFTMVVLALGAAFKLSLPAQVPSQFIETTPNLLITVPRVWQDTNENGIQDLDEPGVADVSVSVLEVGKDRALVQGTTDPSGRCELRLLAVPAHFQLRFDLPPGWHFTSAHRGTNESIDSDANPEGLTTPFYNRSFREGIDAGVVSAK